MDHQSASRSVQSADHDILIGLKVTVDALTTTMVSGMTDIRGDVLELKTGFNHTLTDHEQRLRGIETLRDETRPTEALKQLQTNTQWIANFQARWKLMIAVAVAAGGIGFQLINFAFSFFKIGIK